MPLVGNIAASEHAEASVALRGALRMGRIRTMEKHQHGKSKEGQDERFHGILFRHSMGKRVHYQLHRYKTNRSKR